jgi:hypothetical protein
VGLSYFGYRKAGFDIERNAVARIGAQFRQPPLGQGPGLERLGVRAASHIPADRVALAAGALFILAAVMRELRDDETIALRGLTQRPPNTLLAGSAIEPVLPIVLTERNLSATRFEENHPNHWSPADGIIGLKTLKTSPD